MFADDIALYRMIKSAADYNQLQLDTDSVSSFIAGKYLKFMQGSVNTCLAQER